MPKQKHVVILWQKKIISITYAIKNNNTEFQMWWKWCKKKKKGSLEYAHCCWVWQVSTKPREVFCVLVQFDDYYLVWNEKKITVES